MNDKIFPVLAEANTSLKKMYDEFVKLVTEEKKEVSAEIKDKPGEERTAENLSREVLEAIDEYVRKCQNLKKIIEDLFGAIEEIEIKGLSEEKRKRVVIAYLSRREVKALKTELGWLVKAAPNLKITSEADFLEAWEEHMKTLERIDSELKSFEKAIWHLRHRFLRTKDYCCYDKDEDPPGVKILKLARKRFH